MALLRPECEAKAHGSEVLSMWDRVAGSGKDRDKQGDESAGGKGGPEFRACGGSPMRRCPPTGSPLSSSAGLSQPAWAALKVGDKPELLELHLEQKQQRENPPGSPALRVHLAPVGDV